MFTDMEKWSEIRRRVLVDGLGKRAACREYGIHYKTLKKVLTHSEPPAFRCPERRRPSVLGPLLPVVHQILKDDAKARGSSGTPPCGSTAGSATSMATPAA